MSKAQRTKGHSYERKVAQQLREIGFKEAKRHLEFQSEEAELGVDIDNTDPFLIQCKSMKNCPNIHKVLKQIEDQPNKYKAGFIKLTGKGEYVVMKAEDWIKIIGASFIS